MRRSDPAKLVVLRYRSTSAGPCLDTANAVRRWIRSISEQRLPALGYPIKLHQALLIASAKRSSVQRKTKRAGRDPALSGRYFRRLNQPARFHPGRVLDPAVGPLLPRYTIVPFVNLVGADECYAPANFVKRVHVDPVVKMAFAMWRCNDAELGIEIT